MKLFFKITLMSLAFTLAQAEPAYEGDKDACFSSDFINKTHLSCIACGLKKAGRPAPDDHYLALMGLLARENTSLFPEERNPKYDEVTKKGSYRRSINGSRLELDPKTNVGFTAKAQLQKNTLQLLLASGYCTQGKIKPNSQGKGKENTYSNFVERMISDEAPVTKEEKTKRNLAAKELGQKNWDNAKDEFLYDVEGSSFFKLPFEQQKEFYKKRRALNGSSSASDEGYRPRSEITDCLNDIEQNYSPTYSSAEDSYISCKAIYDECGIAVNPEDGSTMRNGKRVGGDWCATIYKKPETNLAKQEDLQPSQNGGPKGKTPVGGGPSPAAPQATPAEMKRLGEVYSQGDKIVGPEGSIDMTKVVKNPDGSILIPAGAIQLNKQPASLPQPPPSRPAVEVQGTQKAPAATK